MNNSPENEMEMNKEPVTIDSIIDYVLNLLEEYDITGYAVNSVTGLSQGALTKWRNHKVKDIHMRTMLQIAKALNRSVRDVLPGGKPEICNGRIMRTLAYISLMDDQSIRELEEYEEWLIIKQKRRLKEQPEDPACIAD